MTRDELEQYVWEQLSARKFLAGRKRINRLTHRTLRNWPVPVMRQCDEAESQVVGKYLARTIERQERAEVGMGFVAAVILSALIGEIIKILLRKWFESGEGRLAIVEGGR